MPMIELLEDVKVHGGFQKRYQHDSKVLECPMTFSLFLPDNPQNEPLPLIWWLSGLTCNDQNFSTKAAFQEHANHYKMAIAIPDTSPRGEVVADSNEWDLGQGAGFYLNASQRPWQQHYKMYDYILEELSDLIIDLLPNFNNQEAIMGHSMGGYGALMIGLKNPARFNSISAFAPISNPTQVPWGRKAFTAYLGEGAWEKWDPVSLIKQSTATTPILITQGGADSFYPEQLHEEAFLQAAKQSKHRIQYKFEDGYDHSYYMIQTFIKEHLNFHHECL